MSVARYEDTKIRNMNMFGGRCTGDFCVRRDFYRFVFERNRLTVLCVIWPLTSRVESYAYKRKAGVGAYSTALKATAVVVVGSHPSSFCSIRIATGLTQPQRSHGATTTSRFGRFSTCLSLYSGVSIASRAIDVLEQLQQTR